MVGLRSVLFSFMIVTGAMLGGMATESKAALVGPLGCQLAVDANDPNVSEILASAGVDLLVVSDSGSVDSRLSSSLVQIGCTWEQYRLLFPLIEDASDELPATGCGLAFAQDLATMPASERSDLQQAFLSGNQIPLLGCAPPIDAPMANICLDDPCNEEDPCSAATQTCDESPCASDCIISAPNPLPCSIDDAACLTAFVLAQVCVAVPPACDELPCVDDPIDCIALGCDQVIECLVPIIAFIVNLVDEACDLADCDGNVPDCGTDLQCQLDFACGRPNTAFACLVVALVLQIVDELNCLPECVQDEQQPAPMHHTGETYIGPTLSSGNLDLTVVWSQDVNEPLGKCNEENVKQAIGIIESDVGGLNINLRCYHSMATPAGGAFPKYQADANGYDMDAVLNDCEHYIRDEAGAAQLVDGSIANSFVLCIAHGAFQNGVAVDDDGGRVAFYAERPFHSGAGYPNLEDGRLAAHELLHNLGADHHKSEGKKWIPGLWHKHSWKSYHYHNYDSIMNYAHLALLESDLDNTNQEHVYCNLHPGSTGC